MYSVGQVLYAVFKKDHRVIPGMVVEEITKKTLDGLHIDYTIQIGKSKDGEISLDLLKKEAEIFDSPDQAIDVLSSRAKSSIVKIVDTAVQKSSEWYGSPRPSLRSSTEERFRVASEEIVEVTLPDGSVAKAKLPQAV